MNVSTQRRFCYIKLIGGVVFFLRGFSGKKTSFQQCTAISLSICLGGCAHFISWDKLECGFVLSPGPVPRHPDRSNFGYLTLR